MGRLVLAPQYRSGPEALKRCLFLALLYLMRNTSISRKAVQEYGYESDDERGRISVEVLEDFSFRGDETAYLFVLFNLIKNALYYLPLREDGRVTVTVDHHQVRVRDNGPGVPPDLLARMFEPFRSVGKSGGTGLGRPIASA